MNGSRARLIPLGGLGEVGMNCMVLESGGHSILIDCGVLFPDDEAPGVDVIHPDFTYLRSSAAKPLGVVVTHGHEDHIGAIPYLLRELDVPIFGPPFALALVRERLKEHSLPREPRFIETRPRIRFDVGPFSIEPIRVTHSIPDATALCIDTPAGRILHSGDFKIDRTPVDGEAFDEERIRELAQGGIGLLLSDSTNAEVPGAAGSELDVKPVLEELVHGATGAVFVALFSSNVHRVQLLFDAAASMGRKVTLLGRSVNTYERLARELGLLKRSSDIFVTPDQAAGLPRSQILALVSGAQGEPGAALSRLASGEGGRLQLQAGDTVILSSRVIPGNERPVQRLLAALSRSGARIVHRSIEPGVHVSGHAHQSEQGALIEMARPTSFVPVHGTRMFLERHAALARSLGVGRTFVIEDGHVASFDGDGLDPDGTVPHGRIHIDGSAIGVDALRERRQLAESGIALVVVPWRAGRLTGAPLVTLRGVVESAALSEVTGRASRYVAAALEDLPELRRGDREDVRETARLAVRRFLRKELGRIPVASALLMETDR